MSARATIEPGRARGPRGWLLLLAPALAVAACGGAEPDAGGRSVVLLTVDTLRSDALGCYGGDPASTPRIDALAAESVLFENAYTQACRTHPALTSVLTGLAPPHTAVFLQHHRLAPEVMPLAMLLQARGIETGSFVANLCKLQDQDRTVWSLGWDHAYCGMDAGPEQHEWDRATVAAAEEWIAGREQPFFAWIHLMDPHAEHRPPPEEWDYAARPIESADQQWRTLGKYELQNAYPPEPYRAELLELYAAEVRGIDALVGRFVEFLDAHPRHDEIALIFGADHGEELYETWPKHGHQFSLTEGVLRVPLLVRAPGLAPDRRPEVVETLQVTPTVLELLDVAAPYELDGKSLLEDGFSSGIAVSYSGEIVTVRRGPLRLWHHSGVLPAYNAKIAADLERYRGVVPWYDHPLLLATYADATPTRPEYLFHGDGSPEDEEYRGRAESLRKRLDQYLRKLGSLPSLEEIDDPELREQLEQLGYVSGGDSD